MRTLGSNSTESKGIQIQTLPFTFAWALCYRPTVSESQALQLTSQGSLGLSLYFLENFCQVCKFKAIRLGLCSTPHILSLNKIIHDSVIWGLNETALSYCSCKSTRNLLAYAALVLNTLILSTWMKLISQMLEENSNQNISLFNQQIRIS